MAPTVLCLVCLGVLVMCQLTPTQAKVRGCPKGHQRADIDKDLVFLRWPTSVNNKDGRTVFTERRRTLLRTPAVYTIVPRNGADLTLTRLVVKAVNATWVVLDVRNPANQKFTAKVSREFNKAEVILPLKGIDKVTQLKITINGRGKIGLRRIKLILCKDINDCHKNSCNNKGQCKDRLNGYVCECNPGWSGPNCGREENECLSRPCAHDGYCTDKDNGYECFCKKGWAGKQCTIRATGENRCPNNYMRFDLKKQNAFFYDLKISPNNKGQNPVWGLRDAKMPDGMEGFLRLNGDDKYYIKLRNTQGAQLYVGQLCMKTFVVDLVTVEFSVKGSYKSPTIFQMKPVQGTEWFRLSCTPKVTKFKKVDSIVIRYKHQPPNFNMKDLFMEACIPLGIV